MALVQTQFEIDYPESDGQPMGETDLHIEWIIRLRDMLKWRYRGQKVYVGADLLLYFQEGEPIRHVVPDVFVVLDCDSGRRRTFKTWEEGRVPTAVFEITSLSSRRKDSVFKPDIYADIGVAEYFLFDPSGDYLAPSLQGYRRVGDKFDPILPATDGWLVCQSLGIELLLQSDDLILRDAGSGHELMTEAEAKTAEVEAKTAEANRESAARRKAEAELERLRSELRRYRER